MEKQQCRKCLRWYSNLNAHKDCTPADTNRTFYDYDVEDYEYREHMLPQLRDEPDGESDELRVGFDMLSDEYEDW